MIKIYGSTEGDERLAAEKLQEIILKKWPWVEKDINTDVRIISAAKCYGQKSIKDIDLVVFAHFSDEGFYKPYKSVEVNDENIKLEKIYIKNLCLTIEVKGHPPEKVKFEGPLVKVLYGKNQFWHNASEQSHNQITSLRNNLESNGIESPYITNLIWLTNVPTIKLPNNITHNIIGSNATWDSILNVIGANSKIYKKNNKYFINATKFPDININSEVSVKAFTKILEPTKIDQKSMDRICIKSLKPEWKNLLGNKQIIFRGRGGTGKTFILLNLAFNLYKEENARIIILTYNKALISNIRRLLDLIGVDRGTAERSINSQTIHSFFFSVFKNLGILNEDKEIDFLKNYEKYKEEALKYINSGAISEEDIKFFKKESGNIYSWDYIFLDEAQDWPSNEKYLLRKFYDFKTFVIADGIDQFVRLDNPCDWKDGLNKQENEYISLNTCYRMKSSLAKFANTFANVFGINWNLDGNEEVPGGNVIILEGDYFKNPEIHQEIIEQNMRDGNLPIDMLFCVPPNLVMKDGSIPGKKFVDWGYNVWDGVSFNIRETYPTSNNALRIVQYESCRGLEGWVSVNFEFDSFYESKVKSILYDKLGVISSDDIDEAHKETIRWLMIPISRAIDTLIINVKSNQSEFKQKLYKIYEICKDYVEWRTI